MSKVTALLQDLAMFYGRNEGRASLILKALGGLILFFVLTGISADALGGGQRVLLTVVPAALTAVCSPAAVLLLAAAVALFCVFEVSVEAAALLLFLLFLFFVFYVRFFPKESLVVPVMVVLAVFRLPMLAVLFAGVYVGLRAIIPVGVAVFLTSQWPLMQELMALAPRADFTPMGALDTALQMYGLITSQFDFVSWGSVWAVYVVEILAGWAVRSLMIDWEREKALAVSAIVTTVGLCLARTLAGSVVPYSQAIVGTAVSALLCWAFFQIDCVLDYPKAERVRFQDEKYVYYVKAVPKIHRSYRQEEGQ